MAGHEWEDWFEREEFIGQISDIRVQNLQVEREVVQKRTFTRWMNLHLEKCNPPLEVHDLFRDIQDGKILMALLEELSGCKLLHAFKPSSHRIFRLNNIAKVLTFLEERNVKLVSIDAADIADGNSSIVLGLIWNIILFFQIKELTGNIKNQFPSSSSLSSIPTSSDSDTSHSSTPSDERRPSVAARDHGKAIKKLLHWVQRRTRKYGVAVQDFGKSWASGLAFLAVIKSIDPSLVDMRKALLRSSKENIEDAFRTAHYSLGIPRLLEPEDVTLDHPDEQSIMTYVSQFLEHFPGIEEDDPSNFLGRSKVSARMNDPPVRNGVQRKRETSYLVKRDWVQPPPKIFVSSVTEEHLQMRYSAKPRTLKDRPWASEDYSVGSSPSSADIRPLCRPTALNKDTSSAFSSPQPSLIDSAMDSPDSWGEMPSETAPHLQQSCSDGSLSDLRYSTSPGELTSDHESLLLSESVSQGQANADLFIDEGNFSLSSMESLQAKSSLLSEEEDAYRYILDLKDGTASSMSNEDIVDNPNAEQIETSPVQKPETIKPTFHDYSYGDSDSGYYPGHKDVSTTEPEDVSKSSLVTDTDEQVTDFENAVESQSEHCKECLESSITEDFQKVSTEPNSVALFEDEAECPVLKYERISISGSEEDVEAELSEEKSHKDEMEENDLLDVFNSDMRTNEDSGTEADLRKTEEVDQLLNLDHDHQEPAIEPEVDNTDEADQVCSELELPQIFPHNSLSGAADSEAEIQRKEDKVFGNDESDMCEEAVMKDLSEGNQQSANSLAEKNFIEATKDEEEKNCKLGSNISKQLSDIREVGDGKQSQDNKSSPQEAAVNKNNVEGELNGSIRVLENEPNGTKSICEDATTSEERPLEDQQVEKETMKEVEVYCNQQDKLEDQQPETESLKENETFSKHDDNETKLGSQQNEIESVKEEESHSHHRFDDFEDTEFSGSKNGVQKSEITQNYVLTSKIEESLKEPNSPAFGEENEHSFTPTTPSSPVSPPGWDQATVNQPSGEQIQGQTTWEETVRIMGTPERAERYPVELRLSLSVTPLQPAPSQPSHSDSDSERATQEKAGEGSVESPEQSPFELWSRHPGEWGAVDSDLHTDHCELISSDEELSASTTATATAPAARENTEPLSEETASNSVEDESQPSTALCLQEAFDPKESKQTENVETTDAITTENTDERKESSPAEKSENVSEEALSDIYLLLLLWLLVYCLFILPQIDIWAIPSLLLNLEE